MQRVLLVLLLVHMFYFLVAQNSTKKMKFDLLKTSQIQIRDPFILVDSIRKMYYMYAATRKPFDLDKNRSGVMVYKSKDLSFWEKPEVVFSVSSTTWSDPEHGIWAPEVHFYKGKYYLFCTLTSTKKLPAIKGLPENTVRGTQVFISDSPLGPFVPTAHAGSYTPKKWMALDGTLYEEKERPYMVFCREWTQVGNGTLEIVKLKKDLNGVIGKPRTIFKADDAEWTRSGVNYKGKFFPGRVTDGPWFYKTRNGILITLWSSFGISGYSLSYAISESGKIKGPWKHPKKPLLTNGHGHACLFYRNDGQLMLVCHYPNDTPKAHAVFYEINDTGNGIEILRKMDDR